MNPYSAEVQVNRVSVSDIKDLVRTIISADCWKVFSENESEGKVHFDYNSNQNEEEEDDYRESLMNDPSELLRDLRHSIVHFVLGQTCFREETIHYDYLNDDYVHVIIEYW